MRVGMGAEGDIGGVIDYAGRLATLIPRQGAVAALCCVCGCVGCSFPWLSPARLGEEGLW